MNSCARQAKTLSYQVQGRIVLKMATHLGEVNYPPSNTQRVLKMATPLEVNYPPSKTHENLTN